jgi:hypothetical protein
MPARDLAAGVLESRARTGQIQAGGQPAPRRHTATLQQVGVFKVEKLFVGYRYRLNETLTHRASSHVARIDAAKTAFHE